MRELDFYECNWNIEKNTWLGKYTTIPKHKALKGLTVGGFSMKKNAPRYEDFHIEELFCANDVVEFYFKPDPMRRFRSYGNYSSYELKHIVERYLQAKTKNRINYVSNGTLILAMQMAGIDYVERIPDTPNCLYHLPTKLVDRVIELSKQ